MQSPNSGQRRASTPPLNMLRRHLCVWLHALVAAIAAAVATGSAAQRGSAFVRCPAPQRRRPSRTECGHVAGGRHADCSSSPASNVGDSSSAAAARTEQWKEAVLPYLPPERCRSASPAESLRSGEWFKLICGASFEDLPAVRDLALVYTLAGADCIDVAAEEAVIEAARDGIVAALGVAEAVGRPMRAPWVMMSVNDDEEDPHFRKAVFDPGLCPAECPRPCERVCPADAVIFPDSAPPPPQRATMVEEFLQASAGGGVLEPRCYGCGRCISVCPPGIIRAAKYKRSPSVVRELLEKVDGVEIHTKGNLARFKELWEECIAAAASQPRFKVVAVSFPDLGEATSLALASMGAIMEGQASAREGHGERRRPGSGVGSGVAKGGGGRAAATEATAAVAANEAKAEDEGARRGGAVVGCGGALNVWQTDGRPMSGDIGRGATAACIKLAEKVLHSQALPFGEGQHFVQLAGGTNDSTAPKLREMGLIGGKGFRREQHGADDGDQQPRKKKRQVGGVAYGGYARKAVGRALDRLPGGADGGDGGGGEVAERVEDHPHVLSAALEEAALLVGGLKLP